MAKKRMFSIDVIDTDAFLELPLSAQALYFHLNMRADDDGFVGNPRRIQSYVKASEDDLKILIIKRFLITFDDGVMVIKHWRMHNTIQNDRYKKTNYIDEFAMLGIKENNAYTIVSDENNSSVSKLYPTCIQTVSPDIDIDIDIDLDIDIDKDLDLDKGKDNKKSVRHKYGLYKNVLLTDAEMEKLKDEFPDWENRIERLSEYMASTGKHYKSHLATIRNWARRDGRQQNSTLKIDWDSI